MSLLADPAGALGLIGGAITSVSALTHRVVSSWAARGIEAERQRTIRQMASELVQAQAPGVGVVGVRYSTSPDGTVSVEVTPRVQ
jgi:hypothetical protein